MKQILRADTYAHAADGTEVSVLLNAARGPTLNGDLSLAVGRLAPGICSAVHFHPVVTQLAYVLSGRLGLWMQEPGAAEPYRLDAAPGDAAVTQPGTLLQLRNDTKAPTTVLYVVTPGYLQELDSGGEIVFDDALIAGSSWDALHTSQLNAPALRAFTRRRAEVKARLSHMD